MVVSPSPINTRERECDSTYAGNAYLTKLIYGKNDSLWLNILELTATLSTLRFCPIAFESLVCNERRHSGCGCDQTKILYSAASKIGLVFIRTLILLQNFQFSKGRKKIGRGLCGAQAGKCNPPGGCFLHCIWDLRACSSGAPRLSSSLNNSGNSFIKGQAAHIRRYKNNRNETERGKKRRKEKQSLSLSFFFF